MQSKDEISHIIDVVDALKKQHKKRASPSTAGPSDYNI